MMKLSFSDAQLLLLWMTVVSLIASKGAKAAGTEERVLIETKSVVSQDSEERISYKCTYRNLWIQERQPVNFPEDQAAWNGPIMWTSTLQYQPWKAGFGVTSGVEKLAEDGYTDLLIAEMQQQGEQVLAWSDYLEVEGSDGRFSVADKDFVHLPPIETNNLYPYLSTLVGMDPSPDWYTGFHSFWLIDENTRTYYDHLKIQTYPWDAGTDAGTTYNSLTTDLDPILTAEKFVVNNAPEGGELLNPEGTEVPVVAEWECFLNVGEQDLILPDCDWFANPCCNESDTTTCGATLPNGALPDISPEYQEVIDARWKPSIPDPEQGQGQAQAGSGAFPFASWTAICMGLAVMQWLLMV